MPAEHVGRSALLRGPGRAPPHVHRGLDDHADCIRGHQHREFFIDNQLIRVRCITGMILRAGRVPKVSFPGSLTSTFLQVINTVHWDTWGGAGCQEQLSAGHSDTLIGVNVGRYNRGRPWTFFANRTNANPHALPTGRAHGPDIVVLSAGASHLNPSP